MMRRTAGAQRTIQALRVADIPGVDADLNETYQKALILFVSYARTADQIIERLQGEESMLVAH